MLLKRGIIFLKNPIRVYFSVKGFYIIMRSRYKLINLFMAALAKVEADAVMVMLPVVPDGVIVVADVLATKYGPSVNSI